MTTVSTTTPATGNPGNLPTPPAFSKISHILRERIVHRPAPKADPLARQQSLDAIARHQYASNAISTATWHLNHGRTKQALGRILSAARHLKQACSEAATSGRA